MAIWAVGRSEMSLARQAATTLRNGGAMAPRSGASSTIAVASAPKGARPVAA
nr:hypothetical protein [Microtetraspora sp. NBRC 13810]